jgi:hypothetical protein
MRKVGSLEILGFLVRSALMGECLRDRSVCRGSSASRWFHKHLWMFTWSMLLKPVAGDSVHGACMPSATNAVMSSMFGKGMNCSRMMPFVCYCPHLERFPSRYRGSTESFLWRASASHAQAPYIQVKTAIDHWAGYSAQGTHYHRVMRRTILASGQGTASAAYQ